MALLSPCSPEEESGAGLKQARLGRLQSTGSEGLSSASRLVKQVCTEENLLLEISVTCYMNQSYLQQGGRVNSSCIVKLLFESPLSSTSEIAVYFHGLPARGVQAMAAWSNCIFHFLHEVLQRLTPKRPLVSHAVRAMLPFKELWPWASLSLVAEKRAE
ncbi:LYR motif-containing protein 9 isoform X2 [Struthio camelus]|uniref:LYR motif-containing protein 9 isoform X2 n=1 Tax=Struthio camelus TaxID=8801 RepID=UPI003603D6FE